jgi:hypothetical protein
VTDLATFVSLVSEELRDTIHATWTTAELTDLVNQGIDALADFFPKEVMQTVGTVSAGVYSYPITGMTNIYRIDIYSSAGSYKQTLVSGIGGPNTGWELHGGVLYLPPSYLFTAGDTLRAWGYGRYIQLAVSSSTTDLDSTGIWAVVVFCQAEAFGRMMFDRAQFQQWQSSSNNSDITALALAQLAGSARARWRDEQRRLRRLRKTG